MKFLNYLLLIGAVLGLTACPFLDPPPPIAPLAASKTQKTSFKAQTCRLVAIDAYGKDTFGYDTEGKLTSWNTTFQDGRITSVAYSYDPDGYMVRSEVKRDGNTTIATYAYDAQGLLKTELVGGITYHYANGKMTGATANGKPLTYFELDGEGRLAKATIGTLFTTTFEYDIRGNLIRKTFTDAQGISARFEWVYDDKSSPFRLVSFKGYPASKPFRSDGFDPEDAPNFFNNPLLARTFLRDPVSGILKLNGETNYTYRYNARGLPIARKIVSPFAPNAREDYFPNYSGCE